MSNHIKKAVVLVNLGTPDKPSIPAIRVFLKEFLSDRRVVDMPRLLWLPILYVFILPFRPKKILNNYRAIWQEDSPLRIIAKQQAQALQIRLSENNNPADVHIGMTYGKPALADCLTTLTKDYEQITVLPLYPQYSRTTTESVRDIINNNPSQLHVTLIEHYYDNARYIKALAYSVGAFWSEHGQPQKLILSYHGLPQNYVDKGDPYAEQCEATSQLLAKALGLSDDEWIMSYQSRVGGKKWLQPYTETLFETLPKQGVVDVQVLCPGFSVDCLETLDEIANEGKHQFMQAGGQSFRYIPALNAQDEHIQAMTDILTAQAQTAQARREV